MNTTKKMESKDQESINFLNFKQDEKEEYDKDAFGTVGVINFIIASRRK